MEFLTMMIEHHGVAIKASKDAMDKVEHDGVRARLGDAAVKGVWAG